MTTKTSVNLYIHIYYQCEELIREVFSYIAKIILILSIASNNTIYEVTMIIKWNNVHYMLDKYVYVI